MTKTDSYPITSFRLDDELNRLISIKSADLGITKGEYIRKILSQDVIKSNPNEKRLVLEAEKQKLLAEVGEIDKSLVLVNQEIVLHSSKMAKREELIEEAVTRVMRELQSDRGGKRIATYWGNELQIDPEELIRMAEAKRIL